MAFGVYCVNNVAFRDYSIIIHIVQYKTKLYLSHTVWCIGKNSAGENCTSRQTQKEPKITYFAEF